jgi:hypothetical protein
MDYIDTYVQFEKLTDYHTFGRGMVVYLHYKDQRIEKRFSCVVDAMKYAIEREQAKKEAIDKTRPNTDKTRHNTQKKLIKKYSGKLPAFVCSNLCILETGREIRLSYFGDKVDTKTAREIILNLCVLYRKQTSKGLGQTIDQRDVFTIIAELIQNESISYEEAKETALIFCSDYFFTSNIEQYTTQG